MNVYDFDRTIYPSDSTVQFCLYAARRYKRKNAVNLVKAGTFAAMFKMGRISLQRGLDQAMKMTKCMEDLEAEVEQFWDMHEHEVLDWYLQQRKPDDLIISAAPDFLMQPIAKRLGVDFIASKCQLVDGKPKCHLCYGREKVRRILDSDIFSNSAIEEFYSDSLSDTPLALCSEKAFLVLDDGLKRVPWPEVAQHYSKIRRMVKNT